MRSFVIAIMVVAMFAPVASAIPINPTASNEIAAVIVTDEGIPWLLRTNGEVWRFVDGQWLYPVPGYPNLDLPIGTLLDSITNVGDWQLWALYRNDGAILYHGLGAGDEWGLLPAPPFSPVAIQRKSLGGAKQSYR